LTETLACFVPGRAKELSVYTVVRQKKFFAVTFSGNFYKTTPDGKILRKVIHSRPVTTIGQQNTNIHVNGAGRVF